VKKADSLIQNGKSRPKIPQQKQRKASDGGASTHDAQGPPKHGTMCKTYRLLFGRGTVDPSQALQKPQKGTHGNNHSHNPGQRNMQQGESEERCDCRKPLQTGPESATTDLKECAQNQSDDNRLQHAEQEGHPPDSSVSCVEQTEPQEDGGRGKNKQGACQEPAYFSVQLPTNVDGELLRFRSRQQHAVTQRVEEMV
jgi:hypothetical protein